jgi:hypothetical protein
MTATATRPALSIQHAAVEQIQRGRAVVPVPPRQKGPTLLEWQKLRLAVEDVPTHFSHGENIGIILGAPSRLVDVDQDCPEAVAVADRFLPMTGMIHGRPGKPRSHRWYSPSPIPATRQYRDINGAMLVELRSTGGQTLIPPAVHPSGEVFCWDAEGDPAPVEVGSLQTAVAKLAACALVARHWPATGSRHDAANALAGFLLRGGWGEDEATTFIEAVIVAAHDEEWRDRLSGVRSTLKALVADRPATGRPTLAELLSDGEKVVARVSEWLTLRRAPRPASPDSCYAIEGGRLCRVRQTREGPITEPLANFTATVSEEIIQDDGAEATRAFLLTGHLASGEPLPPARVPAARFSGMTWVADAWGLRAVVRAGQATRDYLREAIQVLSPEAPQRRVFMHTGWRKLDGAWAYLTAGGAVGRDGLEVDLGPELARYSLPRASEDPVGAMRASLRLLDLAPLTVTAPLWAGVYRAPLAELLPLDVSLWVEAPTGALKSTLAGLFLSHYGNFDRTHLPGAWASTANQLERRAFLLKDALFVVDDYAPTALDAREVEAKAARLLRAQGNLAGRGRLRADLTERPAYPPRGLIVATGEQHPPGQSVLARMLVVEPKRGDIDLSALTEAQRTAGRLPHALAGYVGWLAPQMDTLPALLRETFSGARARVQSEGHLRVPEAIAHLWIGLVCGLAYAEEVGACSGAGAEALRARCWDAFTALGGVQARLVEGERPSLRFLRSILAMVSQGRGLLLPRDEKVPDPRPGVDFLGWQDEEALYLLPEAAHMAVARFCRDAGEPFPVRRERLLKDLALEQLAECDAERHTRSARVGGAKRRVVYLKRPEVVALLGEDFPSLSPLVPAVPGILEDR